jgi:hypothetical protein
VRKDEGEPQAQSRIVSSRHIWVLGLLEQMQVEVTPLERPGRVRSPYSKAFIDGEGIVIVYYSIQIATVWWCA